MLETFDFCPDFTVPETVPPEPQSGLSMNGWRFTSRPAVPYRRKFKLKLQGLQWFLLPNGLYDVATNPTLNAHRLEKFYQRHENWLPFNWTHPHLGSLVVQFEGQVIVPAAEPNSNGLVNAIEINLLEYNPA